MKTWQSVVIDFAVIAAVTLMAILHVVSSDAVLAIVASLAGARVTERRRAGKGGSVPPSSAVVGLVLGLASLLLWRRT